MTVNVYKYYNSSMASEEVGSHLDKYRKFNLSLSIKKVISGKVRFDRSFLALIFSFCFCVINIFLLIGLAADIITGIFLFFSLCITLALFVSNLGDYYRKALQEQG